MRWLLKTFSIHLPLPWAAAWTWRPMRPRAAAVLLRIEVGRTVISQWTRSFCTSRLVIHILSRTMCSSRPPLTSILVHGRIVDDQWYHVRKGRRRLLRFILSAGWALLWHRWLFSTRSFFVVCLRVVVADRSFTESSPIASPFYGPGGMVERNEWPKPKAGCRE